MGLTRTWTDDRVGRRAGALAALLSLAVAVGLGAAIGLAAAGCDGGRSSGGGGGSSATQTGATGSGPQVAELLAGVASVDITPGPGVPLGGYGAEPRRVVDLSTIPAHIAALGGVILDPYPSMAASIFAPNQGVLDPLSARALVLSNGVTKAAIIRLDTIGVARHVRDDLLPLANALGIPPENLLICATHTHSGPAAIGQELFWQLVAMDLFHEPTYRTMVAGIEDALRQADAALQPARIGFGAADETRATRNRAGRPGVFDPEVGLIKVTDPDGAPIAALINFAVHGTCFGAGNMLFSADVSGHIERELERRIGGGVVAMFLNGAEGDVSPRGCGSDGGSQVGQLVSETAEQLWGQIATKERIEIQGAIDDVFMPPATLHQDGCPPLSGSAQNLCGLLPGFSLNVPLHTLLPDRVPLQVLRLDDVVLASAPGEPITDIGLAIKANGAQRGFRHTFVVGLANDHVGYFTTFEEYARGGYEALATLYGPFTGDVLVDGLGVQMDRVR